MNTKNILEKSTNILLYICIFFISMPGIFFNKLNQILLVTAIVYILAAIVWLYKENRLREIIVKGKMYFILVMLIFSVSTVKYMVELFSAKDTTFFTVYQMVVYAAVGFFIFAKAYINNKVIDKLLTVYTYTTTALIIIFQNKYLYDLGQYRLEGIYGNPNILALYAVIAVMLLICMISRKSGVLIVNEVCIGICIASCLLSQSRGGMLGLAAGLAVTAVFSLIGYRKKINWKMIVTVLKKTVFIVIVIIVSLLAINPSDSDEKNARVGALIEKVETQPDESDLGSNNTEIKDPAEPNDKMSAENGDKEASMDKAEPSENRKNDRFSIDSTENSSIKNNLRFTIWKGYAEKLPNYFWFGTDYSLNDRPVIGGRARDAHNTLIYFLFRFGIFVTLSVVALWVYIIVGLLKRNKKINSTSIMAIVGLLMSLFAISFVNDLVDTPLYYFVIAVSYAFVYVKNNREKTETVHVLQVYSTLNKGGAESRIMDIYRKLDRNSVQFDFVVTSPHPEQQFFYHEIKKLGGEVYEIVSWRKAGFRSLFAQWRKIFENKEYAAVHSNTAVDSGIALFFAWLNNIPMRIAHARNGGTYDVSRLRRVFLFIAKAMTIVFSTHKFYCSEESARYVYGKGYKIMPRTYFMPNAIDLGLYYKIDNDTLQKIKNDLKIPECEYIVGTVGNARTVKNHIFLVKAFKRLLEINSNVILLIVGKNDEDQEAKKYVKENKMEGKVFFVGQRYDIPQLLHVFDVFVLPSLSEGAPGSVIEAQAAGVPCILSDSITRAVDAGCGLVKYISLNDDMSRWAEEILSSCKIKPVDIDFIHDKLYQKGYDVSASADKLVKIYKSGC